MSLLSAQKLYEGFVLFATAHVPACKHLPASIRNISVKTLLRSDGGRMNTKKYWEESARKIGLANSEDGMSIIYRPMPAAIESEEDFDG